jgi:hypothetical protein
MWTGGVRAVNFNAAQSGSYQDRAHSGINAQKEPRMTVGELRKKLEGIDPETKVVVQWEIDVESLSPPTLTWQTYRCEKVLCQDLRE